MLKDAADFLPIGFKFLELEGTNCQLNTGNNEKILKVHVIINYRFYELKTKQLT